MTRIYLDYQATTPVDPRVMDVVLQAMRELPGNAASTHAYGQESRAAVEASRQAIAASIGASPHEIVFTSGATESNNLAIKGLAAHPRQRRRHIVSVSTEHRAVLDPMNRLGRESFQVDLLPPAPQGRADAGRIDPQQVADAIRQDTMLVSVMLANNEMGVIQPIAEIAAICHDAGVLVHTDATQAIGKIPVDVGALGVDLMSFSAHKLYGPKGIGALYVCRRRSPIRLAAQMDGGGHESGLRSGTLPVPLVLGFAKALQLCDEEREAESARLRRLRDALAQQLGAGIAESFVNGPDLRDASIRLAANLNMCLTGVAADSLMLQVPDIAFSSGSACSAALAEPSHVLLALGLSEDQVRASVRLSLGRFTTADQIALAAERIIQAHQALRRGGFP